MDIDEHISESEDEEGGLRVGDIYIPPPPVPYCSAESKGARLMIKQIVNFNFKSYYGKVVLGPLHHKFTSILGPNGSGKSNVIDSMLFVFGFRAQKIRSKKLSVLLHKSSQHPSVTHCTVDVYFHKIIDKADGTYDIVPNSEFVISRTAYANESSCYMIDNKKVQFKEVSKLLKLNGIDLNHNRFLILQGEIESIALMKPLEFLSYLEDIIGTSRLQEPTLQLQKKLDTLNDERDIKHKRAKLAEREMRDLEKPMNEAIEYLQLENKLAISKNIHIQKLISNKNKKLQEIKADLDAANDILQKHDNEQNKIGSERVEIETKLKEDNKNYDTLVAKREEFDQMLKNAITKYTEVKEIMVNTNKRRKQIMKTLETEESKLEELKNLPEKSKSEIVECEKKIANLTKKKEQLEVTLEENLRTLNEETKSLIEERDIFQTQLIELNVAVNESKSELSVAESNLQILKYNETTELGKFENLTKTFEDSNKSVAEKQEKLNLLNTNVAKVKVDLSKKREELKISGIKEQELQAELQRNRAKLDESTNALQASRSNNRILDALMKQKMSGNLPGILGRLGDLGAIDAKYDVAISTCCGRLDNIVVDSVDTAQACIEYLKQHDVGRASFIALEKISYLANQCQNKISTPENVPRLFDCVRVEDERVRPAFYFALRDTLVAEDLEQGTRIAYGATRYRVVTLKGGVIETSGTMSGGGKTMMRGKMGQSVKTKTSTNTPKSNKELEHLKQRINDILEQLQQIQQNKLNNDIDLLIKDIRTMENEIKKLTIDLKSLNDQLPRLQEQIDTQREKVNETKTDLEQVRKLETIVKQNRAKYDKSQKAADIISVKANAITNQIDQIKKEKVGFVKKNIDNFTKQIDTLNINISKLNVQISSSERNVKKAEDKIANLKTEIVTAENLIRQSSVDHKEMCEDSVKIKAKMEDIVKEIESMTSCSGEFKSKIEKLLNIENQLKIKRLELEQNVESYKSKHNEVLTVIPNLKQSLKLIKLQEIPGEEPCEALKTYTEEELESHQANHLHYQVTLQEEQLKNKNPNLSVIDEYLKKKAAYVERINFLEEITNKRDEIKQMVENVNKMRYTEFMQGYYIITKKVKEMYQMITIGGDAELLLTDNMNPFTEGINYSVRPPRKSWKNITNLSGGEKTLSSLALVFALHYYNPSPLYVMDEIDAALDFKNVSIVAYYIKRRTKNAQFLIISLRSNMFELSDRMVGIYKVDDCTNAMTINNTVPIDEGCENKFESLKNSNNQNTTNKENINRRKTTDELSMNNDFEKSQESVQENIFEALPLGNEIAKSC